MTKLGRVSKETKGVPKDGYAETPDFLVLGRIYKIPNGR